MRSALIAQWQAAGYLLVLAGLMTYTAAITPFWSVTFGLGTGAILLVPLVLSQMSLCARRRDLAYFFALQGALIYLLLCLVGSMDLLGRHLPTTLDGILLLAEVGAAGAAGISASGAALALRTVPAARRPRISRRSARTMPTRQPPRVPPAIHP